MDQGQVVEMRVREGEVKRVFVWMLEGERAEVWMGS